MHWLPVLVVVLVLVFLLTKPSLLKKSERPYPVFIDSQEEYLNQPVKYDEWLPNCQCKLI